MGNVLEAVDAAASLFDKRVDLRALVVSRRDDLTGDVTGAGAAPSPAPDAVAEFEQSFDKARPRFDTVLMHVDTVAEVAEAGRQPQFGDLAAMTPQQAAIAAAVVLYDAPKGLQPETIADAWVAARGVPFAACAAAHLAGIPVWKMEKSASWAQASRVDAITQERFAIAARARRYLAVASDDDHAAAFADVQALPDPTHVRQMAVGFLFPERQDWVDQEIARARKHDRRYNTGLPAWLLLGAVTTKLQVVELAGWTWSDMLRQCPAATATAFATVGTDMAPALAAWAEHTWGDEEQARLLHPLAGLDSDEAMRTLVAEIGTRGMAAVLLEAVAKFPERGVRLLAEEMPEFPAPRAAVERVLRVHVTGDQDVARAVLPRLGPDARARVEKLLKSSELLPIADPQVVPELLVTPPWAQPHAATKPVVIRGLMPPDEAEVVWLDEAERERWVEAARVDLSGPDSEDWDKLLAEARRQRWKSDNLVHVLLRAPQAQAREALNLVAQLSTWGAEEWIPAATVRFGAEALPAVLNTVQKSLSEYGELIMPFAGSVIAPLATDWYTRLKTARSLGRAWLLRHPGVAARALIPQALGKAGKSRESAEAVLHLLASEGFDSEVRAAAIRYGTQAEEGIAELLARDPLSVGLPKTMPAVPVWAEPPVLPQLLLAGRGQALPLDAVRVVVRMLTISGSDMPYAGLEAVKELCDPRSLAAFAWALFENWQAAGYPAKQSFAFAAQRWFGDDDTVRKLSPLIRVWPGEGGHARAVTGLDVLAAIGGDTALIHLYGISQKVKFKGLKDTAQARITAIAEELRLTREQLADRLVPSLGLDDAGALELDYGARRFTVFFDEQLKPGVTDKAGKRLKALPKPGAKDDGELAPAAYQRFSGLKKDVRTLASDQIARLELAMVTRRRWSKDEFEEYLVRHPLMRHLVRRLVWADFAGTESVGQGGGVPRAAFRVAEDLSYADVEDDPFTPSDDAVVGVAHRLDLGEDLSRWSEVFADYEILQPFQQLGRAVFTLTPEEAAGTGLKRFDGLRTPAGKVLGLERRGWRRSAPADAGWQGYLLRDLPGGRTLVIDLDPGFGAGWAGESGDQEFKEVWIGQERHGYSGYWHHRQETGEPFSVLDAVTASEILRDLTEVTGT